ncbi:hypothetical protein CYLTODRAFT_486126 [Cylindrobasidium torrendii FP15055 ss-10]|uniref:RRM domain-containing protein n=1 Tax=Cylindrobasidium torrendii FP15055 ss-10 TaxID=1314674 RepID=A0A0D7BQE0_9AGAR|nr:hypothetical protein CYLTODRAFT_486126 [Cylindrobasidium torrendii FP15055 ss-10]
MSRRHAPYPQQSKRTPWDNDADYGMDEDEFDSRSSTTNNNNNNSTNNNTANQSKQLLVDNLHFDVSPEDLTRVFGAVGPLARAPGIRYDRSGRSTGSALVTYVDGADASEARRQLDGKVLMTQPLHIKSYAPSQRLMNRIRDEPAAKGGSLLERMQAGDREGDGGGREGGGRVVHSSAGIDGSWKDARGGGRRGGPDRHHHHHDMHDHRGSSGGGGGARRSSDNSGRGGRGGGGGSARDGGRGGGRGGGGRGGGRGGGGGGKRGGAPKTADDLDKELERFMGDGAGSGDGAGGGSGSGEGGVGAEGDVAMG